MEGAKKIGEEVTEILEYTPGRLWIRKIVRPKYALPEEAGIVIADMPSLPIPKGNAGASLLAHIAVSKFADHIPFYRLQGILKRSKVTIAESTINSWMTATFKLISPLYDYLVKQTLESGYVQGDETPIPVLTRETSLVQRIRDTIGCTILLKTKWFSLITTRAGEELLRKIS